MNEPRDPGRLWRRAIGIAAFVLFLGGLLVAIDLEEVVILAGAVGALCALAGAVTWLLARYRRAMLHGAAGAYRAAAPVVVRMSRRADDELRGAARRAGPVLRRADDELGAAIHRLGRFAARAAAALAADIHAHREARSGPTRPRARAGGRPIPARSPAARRADARRSAAERRRGRA